MVKYFIHTNAKQELASKITQFNSMHNYGAPKASIIKIEDYLDVDKLHNKTYLRNGIETIWDKNDLQSFTILRFLIPELSSYEGISVLTDPDVFLLKPFDEVVKKYESHDLTVRRVINSNNSKKNYLESSIMIFNNEKFKHISFEKILDLLFAHKLDYKNLIHLNYYIDNGINIFEADESFNSFDKYDNRTEFLHTTNRITQPWKTGLKIDFIKYKFDYGKTNSWAMVITNIKDKIKNFFFPKKYIPHPEKKITDFFDALFKDAYKNKHITRQDIVANINNGYISKKYLLYLESK